MTVWVRGVWRCDHETPNSRCTKICGLDIACRWLGNFECDSIVYDSVLLMDPLGKGEMDDERRENPNVPDEVVAAGIKYETGLRVCKIKV